MLAATAGTTCTLNLLHALPCRELAFQIAEQFQALGAGMSLRDCVVIGGVDMAAQARSTCAQRQVAGQLMPPVCH